MKFKIIIFSIILCLFNFNYISAHQQIKETVSAGEKIVQTAKKYIGNPYIYGGNSLINGCDCSHFVWLVLKQAINYTGDYITSYGFETIGKQVLSLDDAEAGDIICYGSHVAIYDGKNKIIQAKNSQYGITYGTYVDFMPIVTIRRIN